MGTNPIINSHSISFIFAMGKYLMLHDATHGGVDLCMLRWHCCVNLGVTNNHHDHDHHHYNGHPVQFMLEPLKLKDAFSSRTVVSV